MLLLCEAHSFFWWFSPGNMNLVLGEMFIEDKTKNWPSRIIFYEFAETNVCCFHTKGHHFTKGK